MDRNPAGMAANKANRGSARASLEELDAGEREAIALAEALHADALIIDEKMGRREAERRKLRVIGTLRVLDDAAEARLIDWSAALSRSQD
jgi:predicted nucleic acid-binding protein